MPERSSICLLVSLLSNRSHNVGRSSLFPKVKRAIHSTAIAPLTLTLSLGERLQTQYSPTPDDAPLPFRSRTCNCNGWYFSWRMRSPILARGGRVELTYLIQPTILFNSRPTTAMGAFQSQRRLVAHVAKKSKEARCRHSTAKRWRFPSIVVKNWRPYIPYSDGSETKLTPSLNSNLVRDHKGPRKPNTYNYCIMLGGPKSWFSANSNIV